MILEVNFAFEIPEGTSLEDAQEWAASELSQGGSIRANNPLVEAGEEIEFNKLDIAEWSIVE